MPKIQEYLPETEGAGPVSGLDPGVERATLFGRGVEQFGQDVEQGIDTINQRTQQAETSQAASALSDIRQQNYEAIQQGTADGTLNTDKWQQSYQDQIDAEAQNYTTPGARNYFNRVSARIGASLLQKASAGQSTIAGNNAQSDYQHTIDGYTNSLTSDPSQYEDIHAQNQETIDAYKQAGIKPNVTQKMQLDSGPALAKAAVMGYINSDYSNAVSSAQQILSKQGPDAIPKAEALTQAVGNFNTAQQMMDKGAFDQDLSAADKAALSNQLKVHQSAAVAEINRLITVQKAAQQEQSQNFENAYLPKMVQGTGTAKDILNSPLTPEAKVHYITMLNNGTLAQSSSPQTYNNLVKNITAPGNSPNKITDPAQLLPYVSKGMINSDDYEKLRKFIDNTPEGQALNTNRSGLIKIATQELDASNPMIGFKDPDGPAKVQQFTQELQHKEAELRANNQPVGSLYDVNSPEYMGKRISQLKSTPMEIMQKQAGMATNQYVAPVQVQINPGVAPPQNNTVQSEINPKVKIFMKNNPKVTDVNEATQILIKAGKLPKPDEKAK